MKVRLLRNAGLFWVTLLWQALAWAQPAFPLQFDAEGFDFGNIGEMSGMVYHRFSFENTGKDTVWIISAGADCHCTAGDFPSGPIAPKEKGSIKVTYDPKGRPWEFESGVVVKIKGIKEGKPLKIKGKTTGGAETPRFSPAEYIQRFLYNEKSILSEDPEFKAFVRRMVPLLEIHRDIKIQIESSASRVPTKSFVSNEELTATRAREAREKMLDILRLCEADLNKIIFLDDITLVQGPAYTSDFKKQLNKYQPFQYVKIRVF